MDWVGGRGQKEQDGWADMCGGAGLQSVAAWEPSGVSVAGNMSTLACMKERSGRPAITFAASSLRFSSFFGFLRNRKRRTVVGNVTTHADELNRHVTPLAAPWPGGGAGLLHGRHEAGEGVRHPAAGAARVQLGRGQLVELGVDAWTGHDKTQMRTKWCHCDPHGQLTSWPRSSAETRSDGGVTDVPLLHRVV